MRMTQETFSCILALLRPTSEHQNDASLHTIQSRIRTTTQSHGTVTISTYNLFVSDSRDEGTVNLVTATLKNMKNTVSVIKQRLHKKSKNLHGTVIKLMIFQQIPYVMRVPGGKKLYGPDVFATELLAKKLNFTSKYIVGTAFSSNFKNAIAQVNSGKIDIGANQYFIDSIVKRGRTAVLQHMTAQNMCFVVAKSPILSGYEVLLTVFRPSVWAAMLIVWAMRSIGRGPIRALLDIIQSISSSCNVVMSRQWCKLLWTAWLFYTLIVLNIINGNMVTRFQNPIHRSHNLSQFRALNYTVYTLSRQHKILLQGQYTLTVLETPNVQGQIIQKLVYEKGLLLMSSSSIRDWTDLDQDLKERLTELPECIGTYSSEYLVRATFPFKEIMQDHLQHILSSGIYGKWINEVYHKYRKNYYGRHQKQLTLTKPLNLGNFITAFSMLAFSYASSFLVFILELSFKRYTQWKLPNSQTIYMGAHNEH